MKTAHWSLVLILAASLIPFTAAIPRATAAATPAPARGGRGGPTSGTPASLGSAMTEMQKLLLAIKAEAPDKTKKDQALKDIAQLIRDAAISKTLTPPWVASLPADKKPEQAAKYGKMMSALLKELLNLEEAIDADNPDDAKKAFTAIDKLMDDGHRAFAN